MDTGHSKWVALLRGVNVGGHNKVPMVDLRTLASGLGWRGVRSYIASGNLVFDAEGNSNGLASTLRNALQDHMNIDVPVLVRTGTDVCAAHNACPWNVAGNLAHLFWCWDDPQPDHRQIDALKAADEDLVIHGRSVWLHAPSGVARSKLMAKMEQVLGVSATARNLNTVRKLAEMVRD